MPCTFTHPLAVVPFRRLCPARLSYAALVVGSMSPDFGYYLGQFPLARFAHTIPGSFAICLPSGLLALVIFYCLRRPLCFILPQPHRAALTPLSEVRALLDWRSRLVAVASLLLGAWSHTIWDSFTHEGAWTVRHLAVLRAPLLQIGGTALPTSYVLQQTSTFGGGAVLAVMYFLWLRRQPCAPAASDRFSSDGWRYVLLGSLVVIALLGAIPSALRMASLFEGYTALRVFVFRTGVYASAIFLPVIAFSACVLHAVHRRSSQPTAEKIEG